MANRNCGCCYFAARMTCLLEREKRAAAAAAATAASLSSSSFFVIPVTLAHHPRRCTRRRFASRSRISIGYWGQRLRQRLSVVVIQLGIQWPVQRLVKQTGKGRSSPIFSLSVPLPSVVCSHRAGDWTNEKRAQLWHP
jgi:hypothetical protein